MDTLPRSAWPVLLSIACACGYDWTVARRDAADAASIVTEDEPDAAEPTSDDPRITVFEDEAGTPPSTDPPPGECGVRCPADRPVCVAGECVECIDGSRRCIGDSTLACMKGSWGSAVPCLPAAPACTNGVCAAARLHGGLVSIGEGTGSARARLRDHGFEFMRPACGQVADRTVCVTGGIRP